MVDHVIWPDSTADEILAMDKQLIELKAKRIFWVRAAVATTALAVVVVVGVITWGVLSIRATQLNGTPTGEAILETNKQIRSCVVTTGECYKRGQDQQAGVINLLTNRTVYAVLCGQKMPTAPVSDVLECVDKMVKAEKP